MSHRCCLRHIHANLKSKGFKGKIFKDSLWQAATSTNRIDFEGVMKGIELMNPNMHKKLKEINPTLWSRHAFSLDGKTDMLLNNIAGSFNAWIKDARDKPIITMLESIRRQLLVRFHKKRVGAEAAKQQTPNALCPKIFKLFEKIKSDSRLCVCQWQSGLEFEIDHPYGARRVVDLKMMTCTCGKWQLTGIPCIHACSAIYHSRHRPEEYVDDCYRLVTYLRSYKQGIHAMPGPEAWPEGGNAVILPPHVRVQPGRPRKARKREPDEPKVPYKVSRHGYVVKCGNCGNEGHNARACPHPENPNKKVWKKKTKKVAEGGEGGTTSTVINNKNMNIFSSYLIYICYIWILC